MNTTHLFVELLVIGVGAFFAVMLLALAVFGYPPSLAGDIDKIDLNVILLAGLLPLLSVTYVLGILVDRLADWTFEAWDEQHLRAVFSNKPEYHEARRTLVVYTPMLWAHLEYGRSRMRICRGWVLNTVLIFMGLTGFYFVRQPPRVDGLRFGIMGLFLGCIFILSFLSWWKLNSSEYKKIERQAEWVLGNMKDNGDSIPKGAFCGK